MNTNFIISVCVVSVIVSICLANPVSEWEKFKNQYNKSFKNPAVDAIHKKAFIQNKKKIDEHNAKFRRNETTFRLKLNQYGDFTEEEIKALFGLASHKSLKAHRPKRFIDTHTANNTIDEKNPIPDYKNWVELGAVTPVKDQGLCGSCYIFSAVAAIESQLYINKGKLISLSEQNVLDCAESELIHGCRGGFPWAVVDYVEKNNGIATSQDYPYEGRVKHCRQDKIQHEISLNKTDLFELSDGYDMKESIANNGPAMVVYDGSMFSYIFYGSGIYEEPKCNSGNLNHASVVVGYGTENGVDYWLVKNSWGETWGEKGYARVARNTDFCGFTLDSLAMKLSWFVYKVLNT